MYAIRSYYALGALYREMNEDMTPIKSINIVYDYTDSDLSVGINDKDNWKFLDDEEVMNLCLYIERKLKQKHENTNR